MTTINFEEYKQQIESAINGKLVGSSIIDPQGFILLDGFINMSINKQVGNSLVVGGPSMPCVAIVAKSTGIVHTFALKVLLPHIQM